MSVVTWQYAADELRLEARTRGDLDDRTVQALAAWFEQLGRGYSESNLTRVARQEAWRTQDAVTASGYPVTGGLDANSASAVPASAPYRPPTRRC